MDQQKEAQRREEQDINRKSREQKRKHERQITRITEQVRKLIAISNQFPVRGTI
jgi:uncharacterized membrane protein